MWVRRRATPGFGPEHLGWEVVPVSDSWLGLGGRCRQDMQVATEAMPIYRPRALQGVLAEGRYGREGARPRETRRLQRRRKLPARKEATQRAESWGVSRRRGAWAPAGMLLRDRAPGDWPLGRRTGSLAVGACFSRRTWAVVEWVWGEGLFSSKGEITVVTPVE